jgi:hypothetical protein
MYGVAWDTRPIFLESDAFLYNLDDPINIRVRVVEIFIYNISYHLIH